MAHVYPKTDDTITLAVKSAPKDAKAGELVQWETCKEVFSGSKGGKLTVTEFVAKAPQGRRNLRRGVRLGYLQTA